ncbi:MAG: GNAT family N-acetyltransferase [Ilumatobacteraceae bacterium]
MGNVEIRVAAADEFEEMIIFDGLAFGQAWDPKLHDAAKATLEFDRFRVAFDGDTLVGVGGSYGQELTVPGGAQIKAGGVTWIAVAPTHRRQGLLTSLMAELHDDIDAHHEPIAMLTASEGGIYERFGYGIASSLRVVEIDRRRVQVREQFRPPPGTVRMTTLDDPALAAIFDRYRRGRNGEINRTTTGDALAKAHHGAGVSVAAHLDGFVSWTVNKNWNAGHPAHELTIVDLVAITPDAHAALWHTVLSVDLVGPIGSYRAVALDDALPYIVDDPRSIRTTNVNDMLWLHLRDVGAALRTRTYGVEDEMVIEVVLDDRGEQRAQRWRVTGGPEGATVEKARKRPDLTMDRASLGAIYLGGVRPTALARVNRIAGTADALRRADAFFMAERLPHCVTGF